MIAFFAERGLPAVVGNELLVSSLVGFILTFAGGLAARYYRNPNGDPGPFIVALLTTGVLGSSIYKMLQGPGFLSRRPYGPFGYMGYLLGSLGGLWLLGLVCVVAPGGGRRPRRSRKRR